ncbi:SH3 domain-containing protein [Roseibium polysiphoniae]|nr:SH3 domain-containing protein [Roseibium polysiphoniae]
MLGFGKGFRLAAPLALFFLTICSAASAQSSYQASATTNLNFRAGPGTNYEIIGSIPNGRIVTVFNCTEGYGWCDIDYAGQRGWASGKYLAYAGSGTYYGQPIYRSGVYIGLPLIWHSYPIYRPRPPYNPGYRPPPGNRPPGNRPPGYRPPKPTPPIARPPVNRPPPGVRPPRPSNPIARPPGSRPPGARPPSARPPSARPPSYRPRPGARPSRPSGGRPSRPSGGRRR